MATKDFTKPRDEITFVIEPDTFHAWPAMAADVLINYAGRLQSMGDATAGDQFGIYKAVLEDILQPASFERFVQRMSDKANPIDLDQLDSVTTWLFEQYGLRPTRPSETSPTGPSSPESGSGSTENTPVEVSISEPFLSTAS